MDEFVPQWGCELIERIGAFKDGQAVLRASLASAAANAHALAEDCAALAVKLKTGAAQPDTGEVD